MDYIIKELENIFEKANNQFLTKNLMLFETQVSERTLCGALMLELNQAKSGTEFSDYFVDVEYNRNVGGKLKTIKKTIKGHEEQIVTINCDLILHSRGMNSFNDNLIALEMKKATGKKQDKDSDKTRLECLTKSSDQDVWSHGGEVFPEHVCGYRLGIYYEVDFNHHKVEVEYYKSGNMYKKYTINL